MSIQHRNQASSHLQKLEHQLVEYITKNLVPHRDELQDNFTFPISQRAYDLLEQRQQVTDQLIQTLQKDYREYAAVYTTVIDFKQSQKETESEA